MIFGIVLLIGGMALSVGAPSEAREARLLAERGVDTTATVTDVSVSGGGRLLVCCISRYRFDRTGTRNSSAQEGELVVIAVMVSV